MAYGLNTSLVAMIILLLASHIYFQETSAAGECGKIPISAATVNMNPCIGVAASANAKVPPACCRRIESLLKNSPSCFCAVLLSPWAKHSGTNLEIIMTIPKRCNIKNRQVGKKCGRYVLS